MTSGCDICPKCGNQTLEQRPGGRRPLCLVKACGYAGDNPTTDNPQQQIADLKAKLERYEGALVAYKEAVDYRFGPAGRDAETAKEIQAFMERSQELDDAARTAMRDALKGES